MKKNHRLIEVIGFLEHETGEGSDEGAFLVRTWGNQDVENGVKVWLPKWRVEKNPHDSGKPDLYIFDVPEDLALDKELI